VLGLLLPILPLLSGRSNPGPTLATGHSLLEEIFHSQIMQKRRSTGLQKLAWLCSMMSMMMELPGMMLLATIRRCSSVKMFKISFKLAWVGNLDITVCLNLLINIF
jgi:hypothetical protein